MINNLLSQVQQASAQALQNNVPNDVITANGPRPQQALVPFWELPLTTYEVSNNAFNPWDTVILGGLWLPGLGKVLVKTRKRFDVKKKKGSDGAGLTFTGYDPSDVNITLRVWTPIHLDTLQSLMPMLKAKSTTSAGAQATAAELALDISHPALALIAIHSVVVVGVSGLVDVEPKGVKQMEISCLEYVPPAKGDNSATTKKSQNFTNSTAINVPAAAKELPSKDSNFTGPEGH